MAWQCFVFGQSTISSTWTREISGIFHDLGLDGALVLLDDSGQTHHITTGDVKLLDK